MNLRDTIVQALNDEAAYFAGTGDPKHDLASQVLTRLAMKLEVGGFTENEGSVVVPEGGTLVLRIDPSLSHEAYHRYQEEMEDALLHLGSDMRVLVVVANQLGSCENAHQH